MSDDQSAPVTKATRGRKTRIPQDLDLSAADVREIARDAAPASEAVPAGEPAAEVTPPPETANAGDTQPSHEPEEVTAPTIASETSASEASPAEASSNNPAPSSSKALPAVIGLVAGLIGGVGGTLLTPKITAPLGLMQSTGNEVSVVLTERLAKAETALTEAKSREEGFRKALESLEARSLSQAQPNPDIDLLKSRLGALEGESKVLPKEVGVLGTKVETLQPKMETLEKTVETLNGRIAIVGSKDALALANGRLAAQSLLEEEFGGGKPYASTLDLLTRMGGEASLIALVKPFADGGAPSSKALLAEFMALKPKAPPVPSGDTSLMERAKKAAFSLVEIRRTGDIAGKDDAAVFQRIESALAKADLSAAFVAAGQFSPALTPAFTPWRTRLEARIKAGEAVGLLRKDAQTALARAAASAK